MKYSDTFKEKVVLEYLQGPFGYRRLAKNYNIPSKKIIEEWVQAFRAFGKEGLKRKASKTVYAVQFKVDVLHWMKSNSASLSETATRFGSIVQPHFFLETHRYERRDCRIRTEAERTPFDV